ncbi:DUF1904 domain-containing protein [Bdellovibrio bacteriovorus]|uniref:DUF1904 domain-containing protein n=1 Tax=Bdellovibrio bacteriovorus TaxID=959 RepID=UPI0021CFD52E|nr:DUF1904 domain-containing protein [Bdellovibrio bacteriovorus]UXR63731.1 DUF1904 domain-containing protein [Bdellovibrio bacteriovorus]
MPHVRFRAVNKEQVQKLSQTLPAELAPAMNTSPDNFTFELVATHFFSAGTTTESYPFIEVLWFARSQEIQNECAGIITRQLKQLGSYEDVVVVFQVLAKEAYYENGSHF